MYKYGKSFKRRKLVSCMGKRKVTLSLDSKVYSDFQKYCSENAMVASKKIELLIKEVLKKNEK